MINLMIKGVEKIVLSRVNGIILLPVFIWLIGILIEQVKETIDIFKEV